MDFVYTSGAPENAFHTLLDVDPEAPLSDFGWEYLRKTAEFCQENGINLVLFTAPLPSAYLYNTTNYQAYMDALRDFAAENNTVYWDFSLYKDVDTLNLLVGDFSDAHHLNGQGAEKFTAVLCDTIARENAGEDVSTLFYDTVEEKLELTRISRLRWRTCNFSPEGVNMERSEKALRQYRIILSADTSERGAGSC